MKRLVMILSLGTFGFSALAQNTDDKKPSGTSMSIGVEAAYPFGKLGDVTSFGIGGSAKIAIPAGSGAVTLSGGYINFMGKEIGNTGVKYSSTYFIPLKAGYRVNLGESGFNFEPQAGYSVGKGSNGGFTYAGNIGYMINNQIDISARYEGISKSGTTLSFIGARVAYNFSL
jgi:outer membrane autotransporter protein